MSHLIAVARWVVLLVALAGATASASPESDARNPGEVNALVLVCEFYGGNYHFFLDAMEHLGWDVTTVGVTPTVSRCFWGGPIVVDLLVSEVGDVSAYDCLVIPTARAWDERSHEQLLESPEALQLVSDAVNQGLMVLAGCGATRVLAAADVLQGIHVTGHSLYVDEYEAAGAIFVGNPVPPVVDGNIMTSVRCQYYIYQAFEIMAAAIDSIRAVTR